MSSTWASQFALWSLSGVTPSWPEYPCRKFASRASGWARNSMNSCLMEPELTSPTKNGRVWAVTAKQAPPKKLTEQISKIARRSEGRDSLKVLLELSKLLPDDGTIRHPSRLAPEKRPNSALLPGEHCVETSES